METQITINKDILIEDLVQACPGSIGYLLGKGIPCIVCGEPLWGTLAEAARSKGLSEDDINTLTEELIMLQENAKK